MHSSQVAFPSLQFFGLFIFIHKLSVVLVSVIPQSPSSGIIKFHVKEQKSFYYRAYCFGEHAGIRDYHPDSLCVFQKVRFV